MRRKNNRTDLEDSVIQRLKADGCTGEFVVQVKNRNRVWVTSSDTDHADWLRLYRNTLVHDLKPVHVLIGKSWVISNPPYARTARKIVGPPGMLLHRFAFYAFSPRTLELIIKPKLADMQRDYFDALAEGNVWRARCIRIRETAAICLSLGLFNLLRLVADIWRRMKIL